MKTKVLDGLDPASIGEIKRPSNWKLEQEGWGIYDEDGKNISHNWYGMEHKESSKKLQSEAAKKRGSWQLGMKRSDESRKKMSDARRRQGYLIENPSKHTLYCREWRKKRRGD